jgi:hypothetical protein
MDNHHVETTRAVPATPCLYPITIHSASSSAGVLRLASPGRNESIVVSVSGVEFTIQFCRTEHAEPEARPVRTAGTPLEDLPRLFWVSLYLKGSHAWPQARTLGPWSSAVALVNARDKAAAAREDKIQALAKEAEAGEGSMAPPFTCG